MADYTAENVLVGVGVLSIAYPAEGGWTDVGYTEDGVKFEYSADVTEIEVEEETYPLDQFLTKEHLKITCNMAESSLYNIDKAISGSVLDGNTITIGGGVMKKMSIRIVGISPEGGDRTIYMPLANATGTVGMSYRKNEKTIVPIELTALKKDADTPVCTINDGTGPEIEEGSELPLDGAIDQAVGVAVSGEFNKAVTLLSTDGISLKDENGDEYFRSADMNVDGVTLEIDHHDFDNDVEITVTIPGGICKDADSILSEPRTWSFTTVA